MAKSKHKTSAGQQHVTKKCPMCYAYIPLDVLKCPACKAAVGKVDKHGMAAKATDWGSYIICFLAWLTFGIYIWFAFFRS